MRDAVGADAEGVLPLLDSRSFTFLIEDPATVWHLGPERYTAIAHRYRRPPSPPPPPGPPHRADAPPPVCPLRPDPYPPTAEPYRALPSHPDKLAIDVNIVDRY